MGSTERAQQAAREYLAGRSLAQLMRTFHVGKATLKEWLADSGIVLRTLTESQFLNWGKEPLPRPSPEALRNLYWDRELSLHQIAMRWGIGAMTVRRWLHEANIPTRSGSQAARVMVKQGRCVLTDLPPGRGDRGRQTIAALRAADPERFREQARRQCAYLTRLRVQRGARRFVPCGWCGRLCLRKPYQIRRTAASCCTSHCQPQYSNWRRWHPDEPRPLILQRLREGADPAEIGAGELEIEAYRLEQQEPFLPRSIAPAPVPIRPEPAPAPRRAKVLELEQIGSAGEALLRAARKKAD